MSIAIRLVKNMSDDLVPEMHDIGKLVDWRIIKKTISEELKIDDLKQVHSHSFVLWNTTADQKVDYLKDVFGVDEPESDTWKVINYHHVDNLPEKLEEPLKKDVDVFLIRLADGMASAISRAMTKQEKKEIEELVKGYEKRSVYKLWHPEKIQDLNIISIGGFPEVVNFIHGNPTGDEFLEDDKKYKQLLLARPEEFMRSIDITSLYTHSKLVGKFYRFFEGRIRAEAPDRISFGGNIANSPENAESQWKVKLIKCSVKLTQNPVRGSDLNVFEKLKEIMCEVSEIDNVLFNSSTEFLAILPLYEDVESIIKPFLDGGFYLEVEEAHTKVGNIYPTPKSIKEREYKDLQERIKKINSNNNMPLERKEELKREKEDEFQRKFPVKIIYSKLNPMIDIPICEVCQMAKGDKEWPKDYVLGKLCADCKERVIEDEWPFNADKLCKTCLKHIRMLFEEFLTENLCENCFETRSMGHRLPKIMRWSYSEDNPKVAWVKISIDIDKLVEVLKILYLQYLEDLKIPDPEKYTDMRLSVFSEFQWDYNKFLSNIIGNGFKEALISGLNCDNKFIKGFGDKDVQAILDDFFCIKIDKTSDVNKILKIYNNLFTKEYFPKFKDLESPIKLSISCSNIKFAFFWHWKFLENPQNDVNVNLVGKGEMHLNMGQLDEILNLDMRQFGTHSLHKLSEVSKVSKKLSKVLLYDKGDWRLYREYDGLRSLLEGGIDFPNILTYAKIMSDQERGVK